MTQRNTVELVKLVDWARQNMESLKGMSWRAITERAHKEAGVIWKEVSVRRSLQSIPEFEGLGVHRQAGAQNTNAELKRQVLELRQALATAVGSMESAVLELRKELRVHKEWHDAQDDDGTEDRLAELAYEVRRLMGPRRTAAINKMADRCPRNGSD